MLRICCDLLTFVVDKITVIGYSVYWLVIPKKPDDVFLETSQILLEKTCVGAFKPATLSKRDSNTGGFL